MVESTAALLRPTLPATVELRLKLDPEAPAIHADRSQLQQLVMNLCVNAVNALGSGGVIEVGVRPATDERVLASHEGLRLGESLELYVRDDGAGMSAEVRARIFDPFFTTRRSEGGSGLGLSVVHGVVEDHGGAIEIETERGAGTTLRVFLPAAPIKETPARGAPEQGAARPPELPGEPEPQTAPPPDPTSTPPRELLIVDDQASLRAVLQRGLELYGYRVTVADTPQAALVLTRTRETPFDLVLTDLDFGEATDDGLSLARDLADESRSLPLVLMTGSIDRRPEEGLQVGVSAVIHKPFELSELDRLIRSLLPEPSGLEPAPD